MWTLTPPSAKCDQQCVNDALYLNTVSQFHCIPVSEHSMTVSVYPCIPEQDTPANGSHSTVITAKTVVNFLLFSFEAMLGGKEKDWAIFIGSVTNT